MRGTWATPTAAKMTAAIAFGALAVILANMVVEAMPDERDMGQFIPINAAIGALTGWLFAGPRSPAGYIGSIGYGLTTVFVYLFLALLMFSGYEMIIRSLRRRYDTGMEAVVAVFQLMVEHFWIMATSEILGTLVIGGILAGFFIEWIGQRFA